MEVVPDSSFGDPLIRLQIDELESACDELAMKFAEKEAFFSLVVGIHNYVAHHILFRVTHIQDTFAVRLKDVLHLSAKIVLQHPDFQKAGERANLHAFGKEFQQWANDIAILV